MKERPILFSAPMVRALLDGSKTQTRRIVKPQPTLDTDEWSSAPSGQWIGTGASPATGGTRQTWGWATCPYGQPGERLWVRESGVRSLLAGSEEQRGLFRHDVPETPETGRYWVERTRAPGASYNVAGCTRATALLNPDAKATPSIHMPRWACRILLEIVSVRVERLNDCSEADARAEGATHYEPANHMSHGGWSHDGWHLHRTAHESFDKLWESINGAGSWAANPWVWVVEFKRVGATTVAPNQFRRETALSCPICCAKKGDPHTPECTESGIA